MAQFRYVAADSEGRRRSGALRAVDAVAAEGALRKRGLLPLKIEAAGPSGHELRAGQGVRAAKPNAKLSHRARLVITRQLATLVEAAVPVDEALGMVAAQQEQAGPRAVIQDVQAGVTEGMRLADALARHPQSFPGLYRAAVAGGERSGRLGFVLERLADYLTREHAIRTKAVTAMIYPAALSLVAITVVVCLMIFVVPSLTEQFETFDADLPLLTEILIGTSKFLTQYWVALLAAIAGIAFLGSRMMRQQKTRRLLDDLQLRLPLVGRWARVVHSSRFVRAVSTLTQSGMPVLDSVRSARESTGNLVVADAIEEMGERIEEGEPLSLAMRKSGVIPSMIVYMAASGENSGELPIMLEKAADHLDQEFEAFTAAALSLLEPAIIVLMGGVVASIVLAIMLPILQLNQLATG